MSSVWRYIELNDYVRPPEPSTEIARKGLRSLLNRLQRTSKNEEPVSLSAELRTVPHGLLDSLSPVPVLTEAEEALGSVLKPWLEAKGPEYRAQIIVGSPGSGTSQILTGWAKKQNFHIIEPFDPCQLFEGTLQWDPKLYGTGTGIVVLPSLESCFLRHHTGLTFIRKLVDYIRNTQNRYIIGCDSWAWAYLSKAIMIDKVFPQQYVLEAFEGQHLNQWLNSLVTSFGSGPVYFRQSDNGNSIFSSVDGGEQKADTGPQSPEDGTRNADPEVHDCLKKLAAHSRGIPLVAWATWRHCLYVTKDEIVDDEVRKAAAADSGFTVWVKPWAQIEMPAMPSDIARCEQFILHTLLVHAGLPEELIYGLLPNQSSEIVKGLSRLNAAGLIKSENDLWRVSLINYPAVRSYLENMNFLVDAI